MVLVELAGQDATGATFDEVMDSLVGAPAGVPIDLVFRDPSAAAAAAAAAAPAAAPAAPAVAMGVPCEITVGGVALKAKTGDNLRKTLLAGKVEVYDMVGKVGRKRPRAGGAAFCCNVKGLWFSVAGVAVCTCEMRLLPPRSCICTQKVPAPALYGVFGSPCACRAYPLKNKLGRERPKK